MAVACSLIATKYFARMQNICRIHTLAYVTCVYNLPAWLYCHACRFRLFNSNLLRCSIHVMHNFQIQCTTVSSLCNARMHGLERLLFLLCLTNSCEPYLLLKTFPPSTVIHIGCRRRRTIRYRCSINRFSRFYKIPPKKCN